MKRSSIRQRLTRGLVGAGEVKHLAAKAFDHAAGVSLGIGQAVGGAGARRLRRTPHREADGSRDNGDEKQERIVHGPRVPSPRVRGECVADGPQSTPRAR